MRPHQRNLHVRAKRQAAGRQRCAQRLRQPGGAVFHGCPRHADPCCRYMLWRKPGSAQRLRNALLNALGRQRLAHDRGVDAFAVRFCQHVKAFIHQRDAQVRAAAINAQHNAHWIAWR